MENTRKGGEGKRGEGNGEERTKVATQDPKARNFHQTPQQQAGLFSEAYWE